MCRCAAFSDAHPLGLARRYSPLQGDLMDEGRGADTQTSREVELLRKRVKTLLQEKSQVLKPWEHTHDWGHKGQPDTTLLYCHQAELRPRHTAPPGAFADPLLPLVWHRRWLRWSCCRRCTPRT